MKYQIIKAVIALHLAHDNSVRVHGSLCCTPAMKAGLERSAWTVSNRIGSHFIARLFGQTGKMIHPTNEK